MRIQTCCRCVMDDANDKTIIFNENHQCNYCVEALNRKKIEYFPNGEGKEKLDIIIEKIKKNGKDKKYDCIVGVSGGVDSSYIIYMGFKYGLKMLAVHLDDGLDTAIAVNNIENLCNKANVDLINIKPDMDQYRAVVKAFLIAKLPNLAMVQDNIIIACLRETAKTESIDYLLSGGNFALESILERGDGINAADKKHIKCINKKFGTTSIDKLPMVSLLEKYILYRYTSQIKTILPLNYINYNLKQAIQELNAFSDYTYYGGKHYESVLTRFMQCYYLPEKFGIDKRKSHYSSMIVSGQMTREEAVILMAKPLYPNEEMKEADMDFLSNFLGMSKIEFMKCIELPRKQHKDYDYSKLNDMAGIARKFRRFLG